VALYTLTNANGLILRVTDYGAIITQLHVPDRDGRMADIVHGFDSVEDYVNSSSYFGATIGRVANRIKSARFELDGKTYELALNDLETRSHLHGGHKGWDKVMWSAVPRDTASGPSIQLTYRSPDGDEGYPGTVTASTTYTLTDEDELRVEMRATTDRTTLVNMANHSYWNLGGTGSGTIEQHELTLFAHAYTPGMPPTGQVEPVARTPFDFSSPKPIAADLKAAGGEPAGYDHNYVVDGDPHRLRPVARVKDPRSGRVMTLEADQPGVQFYTGNFLDGSTRGKGAAHVRYSAFCLESQSFPNSINIPAWRKDVVLHPGDTYSHTMVHRFTTE